MAYASAAAGSAAGVPPVRSAATVLNAGVGILVVDASTRPAELWSTTAVADTAALCARMGLTCTPDGTGQS